MKFIVTFELGRLCRWLRLLGFDAILYDSADRPSLIIEAMRQGRIILTRIKKIPAHKGATVLRMQSDEVKQQIAQLIKACRIKPDKGAMFSRCILCNGLLEEIEKAKVKNRVPAHVYRTQKRFTSCPACKKVYWRGGHWGNALKYLREIA